MQEQPPEGTIFAVVTFPEPWPRSSPIVLLRKEISPYTVEMTANIHGQIVVSLKQQDEIASSETFQEIEIQQARRAIVTASWSKNEISLRINGMKLQRAANTKGEKFLLRGDKGPSIDVRLFPQLDPDQSSSDAEYLLLSTIVDIDKKIAEPDKYDLLRAAGLLRQLLLDSTPLVHKVNRVYRIPLEFEIIAQSTSPPGNVESRWLNPDPSKFPGAKTTNVSLDKFLGTHCLTFTGLEVSVKDVIKTCAHAKGGTHLGKARTSKEQAVLSRSE